MASSINASLTAGLVQTADTSGIINLQSGGTTVATISSTGLATVADATINGLTVGKGVGAVSTNTAIGYQSINATATGISNTAVGYQAGYFITSGAGNTAIGRDSLSNVNTGSDNVGLGFSSGGNITSGNYNTAIGRQALTSNTTASYNTAVGYQAGYSFNTTSNTYNCFIGDRAGYTATTGTANTFVGAGGSGYYMTTGSKNTILGAYNGNQGGLDIRTLSNFIVLSDGDGNPRFYYRGDNNIFYMPAVYANTTATAANMLISSDGSLYRSTSALKYKQNVRDLPSIDINKFRPVVYKSKSENDDQTIDHFGIIADEVHDAGITELVNYGADGEVEGFQYERLTVVLLKAIQELKAEIDLLKGAK